MKDHVEGYHKLTAKTKKFFTTALALYDADFYVKVDDDVHINLGLCAKQNYNCFWNFFSSISQKLLINVVSTLCC